MNTRNQISLLEALAEFNLSLDKLGALNPHAVQLGNKTIFYRKEIAELLKK